MVFILCYHYAKHNFFRTSFTTNLYSMLIHVAYQYIALPLKHQRPAMPIFTPTPTGYKRLTSVPTNASINTVCEHLGYNTDQFYTWHGDFDFEFDINTVALEVFSRNIIFISTKQGVETVDAAKLSYYLRNLNNEEVYTSYNVEDTLTAGIANRSLSSAFLGKVLGSDIESDGVVYASKLNLYLYFTDGYLVDFQASDGLNKWAKHWKQLNPGLIAAYEAEAKRYWGNDQKRVLNEVNVQSDALAGVPQAVGNEFADLHRTENGLVNYRMLLACHYDQDISLDDFLVLNHGRYQELPSQSSKLRFFRLGLFDYIFNDGMFIQGIQH